MVMRILSGESRTLVYKGCLAGRPKWKPLLKKNTEENEMNKSLIVSAVTAITVVVGLVVIAQAQKDKQVIYVSSAQASYKPSPMGGVSMAAL